jgi:hypothetical protein
LSPTRGDRGWRSAPRCPAAGTHILPPQLAPGGDAGKGCVGRFGVRVRLDAPRRGGNGGVVGSAAGCGGNRGGGQLGDLPAPAGARRRRRQRYSQRCGVNGGGGVSLCSGQRTEGDEINEKKNCLRRPPTGQTQQPTKNTCTGRRRKGEEVRPVRSAGGAQFDRWGRSRWAGG